MKHIRKNVIEILNGFSNESNGGNRGKKGSFDWFFGER